MLKSRVSFALAVGTLGLALQAAPASAEQWYFWVENKSSAAIQKLEVSEDQSNWGYFELGSAIAPGEKEKLIWDSSTDNEDCTQWIRATFSDGSESQPAQFDFCKDLDIPIEFSN